MTEDPAAERARLMAEGTALRARARELYDADRVEESFPLRDRVHEINRRYEELLPEVTVARCPHTGTAVRWPIDTAGLDGWFWDYLAAIRRSPESLPPTWLAMTGAMRLAEPVETAPFAAVPGPGAPFVVPRILGSPGVRAVLAEVPVGAHTGWTISYFGPEPEDVRLVNLWGANTYPVYRDGVWQGWDWDRPAVSQYDFDLAGWLRSGALLWIAPGDESATLREGADDCPFTDLPGEHRIAVVTDGRVKRLSSFAGHGAG
ncbi:hypothetical protein [Amycolatopsis sp. WGS_07]|uniref:hypothetical protein n=1 Tax=Amycolatopsis sp. WGS_07 TaxID=3076764 RepID=UPI003872E2CF